MEFLIYPSSLHIFRASIAKPAHPKNVISAAIDPLILVQLVPFTERHNASQLDVPGGQS